MTRKSQIFIAVTALICLGFGFFFSKPKIANAWQTYREIQNTKKDLSQTAQKKEVLSALSKDNLLNNLYDIAAKYIPSDQNSSELVMSLSALAGQSNLSVDQLTFDDAASADTKTTETSMKESTFSMTVSGTFSDFLNFLKNAETSSRLITFDNMNFSASNSVFTAQFSGTAYWKTANALTATLENIKVSPDTINKFQNLKSYSTPTNVNVESGFGRTDPFAAAP